MRSLRENLRPALHVCRGCLATDVRLHDMRQNHLMEAYARLVDPTDDITHFLCSYCAALLIKWDRFRIKCIDALLILRNAQLDNQNLTIQHIRKIDRHANKFTLPYTVSQTQVVNIGENSVFIVENVIKNDNDQSDNDNTRTNKEESKMTTGEYDNEEPEYTNEEYLEESDTESLNVIKRDDTLLNTDDEAFISDLMKECDPNYVIDNRNTILSNAYVKPNFVINSRTKDHNYAQTTKGTRQISELVEQYLVNTNRNHILNNYQVNLYCNKRTLTKINGNKEMKLKIVNQVTASEMNSKLIKLLAGSQIDLAEENAKLNPAIPNITNNGQYITIDFKATMSESALDLDESFPLPMGSYESKYRIENEKFAKNHGMDIVHAYTEKEQVLLMQSRKETNNYKHCKYRCEHCCRGFNTQVTFDNHMAFHSEVKGKYKCNICKYHFKTKGRWKLHKTRHSIRFSCKLCTFTTNYRTVARNHYLGHIGEKFACKHCGKQFNRTSSYYSHLKTAHPTSEELIRCEICGDSFNGAAGIKQHEALAHKEMTSPECLCSGCGTQFYCSDAFKVHQGADGACDPRAKYCVRCGDAFHTQLQLEEHEAEQRKPRDVFECEVCEKIFNNYTYYKAHRACHRKTSRDKVGRRRLVQPSMCEICGAVYKNNALLKMHYKYKHSNEKRYQCTQCPKKFKIPENLKSHIRTHTGERPFRCKYCTNTFQSNTNLARHIRMHTLDRPYLCPVCGKDFMTSANVKTHMKIVHMKKSMPERIIIINKKP